MVEYKIVKYCRMCKKRFVVDKSEAKKNYCEVCQKRMYEEYAKQAKKEEQAEQES